MAKADIMSPTDLCLLRKGVKNNLHVYMPLYKLLLKSVSVFANGSDEKAEEGRTVAGVCIVSATASYQTDYGNMVICELISVCLSRFLPQFIYSLPGE